VGAWLNGSIARFVNHSCSPNCRMIKWIVGGQPRMALFAGDRPLMTGEELTYDTSTPSPLRTCRSVCVVARTAAASSGPSPRSLPPPLLLGIDETGQLYGHQEYRLRGRSNAMMRGWTCARLGICWNFADELLTRSSSAMLLPPS